MTEHEPPSYEQNHDPYWQQDLAIGESRIQGEPYTIRIQLHHEREAYRGRGSETLFPLQATQGQRLYVHARPYILVPDITLTFTTYPTPTPAGAVGEVESSEWEGMRHREIGDAQAWMYVEDGTLILWECFLEDWCQQEEPTQDELLATVWRGFERTLLTRFPDVARIVTPSWENIYGANQERWQKFLRQQGYQPFSQQAWVKPILRERGKP